MKQLQMGEHMFETGKENASSSLTSLVNLN
jgi:hypothetical protein